MGSSLKGMALYDATQQAHHHPFILQINEHAALFMGFDDAILDDAATKMLFIVGPLVANASKMLIRNLLLHSSALKLKEEICS